MATGHIHSIDSFGTVDGPGLRFVIFMQHCEMRCLYCHNPDTWAAKGGKDYTVEEIMVKLRSVKPFLKRGGITVSGGEPLLQADFIAELFEACQREGIHTCLDTNGFLKIIRPEKLSKLLDATDLVMLDVKQVDPERHLLLTKVPNAPVLQFLELLGERNQPFWARLVVVPGWTTDTGHFSRWLDAVEKQKHCLEWIELLPYHELGLFKWEELGLNYDLKGVEPPPMEVVETLAEMGRERGLPIRYSH